MNVGFFLEKGLSPKTNLMSQAQTVLTLNGGEADKEIQIFSCFSSALLGRVRYKQPKVYPISSTWVRIPLA